MEVAGKRIVLFLAGCLCILAVSFTGCEENSPTGPDPTATPSLPPTSTAEPTETPSPSPTPSTTPTPEPKVYRGTSYRGDTGEAIGTIEYMIWPPGAVAGSINTWIECHDAYHPYGYERFGEMEFETTADSSGKFRYEYYWGSSPHDSGGRIVECKSGGSVSSGTWSCGSSWSNGSCSGYGTWIAECVSGC